MDLNITELRRRLPQRNTGLPDRVLRSILAACMLAVLGFGVLGGPLGLFDLLVAVATAYLGFTAATGRDFLYARLRLDTRSEAEAEADQLRELRAADAASARIAAQRLTRARSRAESEEPVAREWGHSVLGR